MMILFRVTLFVLGCLVGYALRHETEFLRGWDEGFVFGRDHGRELAHAELAARGQVNPPEPEK